jgi:hypothetical protein
VEVPTCTPPPPKMHDGMSQAPATPGCRSVSSSTSSSLTAPARTMALPVPLTTSSTPGPGSTTNSHLWPAGTLQCITCSTVPGSTSTVLRTPQVWWRTSVIESQGTAATQTRCYCCSGSWPRCMRPTVPEVHCGARAASNSVCSWHCGAPETPQPLADTASTSVPQMLR